MSNSIYVKIKTTPMLDLWQQIGGKPGTLKLYKQLWELKRLVPAHPDYQDIEDKVYEIFNSHTTFSTANEMLLVPIRMDQHVVDTLFLAMTASPIHLNCPDPITEFPEGVGIYHYPTTPENLAFFTDWVYTKYGVDVQVLSAYVGDS